MRLQHYFRLLGDPSVQYYLRSLIKSGDVRCLTKVVRDAAKGKRRRILPGFEALLGESLCWPKPTTWYRVLSVLPLTGKKGPWTSVELASRSWPFFLENGGWATFFNDPEDGMALHRFGWVLRGLGKGRRVPWDAVASWLHWMRNGHNLKKAGWVMDGYSVSERICNLTLMLHLDPPEDRVLLDSLLKRICEDSIFVIHTLDYFGDSDTNNHILNNARALMFAGAVLENNSCFAWGRKLLFQQLPRHCSEDGIFREASSHYQWVITRWMVEIALLLKNKKISGSELFFEQVRRMLDVCDRLSLGTTSRCYIPRIGDVSPDFPPDWYAGMTDAAHFLLDEGGEPVSRTSLKGWADLVAGDIRSAKPAPASWSSGDWLRLRSNDWSLLAHADHEIADTRASHAHQDIFSFEIAWRGTPLIIDRGRQNYYSFSKSKNCSLLDEWHNSFLIDGKRLGFYPRNFMDSGWISQHRIQPQLLLNGTVGSLTVRQPKQFPFIQSLQRIWQIEENRFIIRTSIDGHGRHSIRFFLYTPCLDMQNSGSFLHCFPDSKAKLTLSWTGISFDTIKKNEWYPSYGKIAPCMRLEWFGDVELPLDTTFTLICVE